MICLSNHTLLISNQSYIVSKQALIVLYINKLNFNPFKTMTYFTHSSHYISSSKGPSKPERAHTYITSNTSSASCGYLGANLPWLKSNTHVVSLDKDKGAADSSEYL